ncbi:class E sortase [Streptomyces hesseae]|uniref:Class E sortase n=1 Tax=Streptomyces hesseae TaxID=3075519 RepID=A0ABU2SVQ1_9ACTN|nr:class E sortase [Streptomyces sp. DSM 40473]MDT0453071.1 class E sortase [Streptomyces sp. DSM 40473]
MRSRLVLRTLSELCLTAGTLIVLFVVYLLYWTGVRADSAMDDEIGRLRERWAAGPPAAAPPAAPAPGASSLAADGPPVSPAPPTPPAPAAGTTGGGTETPPAPPAGQRPGAAFAVMYVPRLGAGWTKPVLEGTGTELLKRGLGHYTGTAPPGGTGNFAVAGHRRTYGDPFKDLDELRPGDAVVINDGTTWFTYRVDTRPHRTLPTDVAVIDPVPAGSGYREPGRYLTLTTCEPEWGHSHRLIVWGHLAETRPVSGGRPAALSG